jgi:hypothetical protein
MYSWCFNTFLPYTLRSAFGMLLLNKTDISGISLRLQWIEVTKIVFPYRTTFHIEINLWYQPHDMGKAQHKNTHILQLHCSATAIRRNTKIHISYKITKYSISYTNNKGHITHNEYNTKKEKISLQKSVVAYGILRCVFAVYVSNLLLDLHFVH